MENLKIFKSGFYEKLKLLLVLTGVLIVGINQADADTRLFYTGQKIFFADATLTSTMSGSCWKSGENGNVYAYFFNMKRASGDDVPSWAESAGTRVYGTDGSAGCIYEFTVPSSSVGDTCWWGVIFTRGTTNEWGDGKTWNQTTDQYPTDGKNLFAISDSKSNSKWTGSWSSMPAFVGAKNSWNQNNLFFTDYSGDKGIVKLTFEAGEECQFVILDGATWYKHYEYGNSFSELSDYSPKSDGGNNFNFTADEAGEYIFQWDKTNHKLWVWKPRARLTKQKYVYFDARRLTGSNSDYWQRGNFTARFWFKYYDSGSDKGSVDCTHASALEDWVYYALVPDDDYLGQIQMNRLPVSSEGTCAAEIAHAKDRTSPTQNCLQEESGKEDWCNSWTPQWTTYCPPTKSETLADNSTTIVPGTSGTGTSGNPILVVTGTTLKVTASASKALADDNMTIKYDFKVNKTSQQDGTSASYSSYTASTNNTVYKVSVDAYTNYNLDNTKSSTKHTPDTIYYKALNAYTIAYKKGTYGTGDNVSDTKYYDIAKTLRGAIFTRDHYTQTGWATTDGGAQAHALSASYTSNADVELYPVWTDNKHTVTVSNDGNGTTNVASVSGVGIATASSTITATPTFGYRFYSWTIPSGVTIATGSTTNPSITINATADSKTITANFVREYMFLESDFAVYDATRANETVITYENTNSTAIPMVYDAENHLFYLHTYKTVSELKTDAKYFYIKASTSSSSISDAVSIGAHANEATYKNLTAASTGKLAGRNKSNTFLVVPTTPEDAYAILYLYESAGNIYLKYELEHAFSYYGNGSDGGSAPAARTYYDHGETPEAEDNTFDRTGYTFSKWNTAADGGGTDYDPTDEVTLNAAEVCLSAQWTPIDYTVTLNNNGATTAGAASVAVTYDAVVGNISGSLPAKTGYSFAGYYDNEELTGSPIIKTNGYFDWNCEYTNTSSGAWEYADDLDLYAKWVPVTLTFKKDAASSNWFDKNNWNPALVPTINHDVVILARCWIEADSAQAKSVEIHNYGDTLGYVYIYASSVRSAAGGLVVAEGITAVHSKGGAAEATTKEDLWIDTDELGNGGLICGSASANTKAKYYFYTKARKYNYGPSSSYFINQYVGIPFASMPADQIYGFNIFVYDADADDWRTPSGEGANTMQPWTAYNLIRQYSNTDWNRFTLNGTLNLPGIEGAGRLKTLTCSSATDRVSTGKGTSDVGNAFFDSKGDYMFANSWTAPISIAALTTSDCSDLDEDGNSDIVPIIYIFNAGFEGAAEKEVGINAGTWSPFPFGASAYMENAVIPATQAFLVSAKVANATLTLDYKKHVYDPAIEAEHMNTYPTRAPRRIKKGDNDPTKLKIVAYCDSVEADNLYIFERGDFSEGYDEGWDGGKLVDYAYSFAPQLYAIHGVNKLGVDAIKEMDGTNLGFKAGSQSNEYTFVFDYNDDEPLYLYDKETNALTQITNEATYEFTTSDTEEHDRFLLTRSNAPQIATGVEEIDTENVQRAQKFMHNQQIFIRRGDKIYSIDGALVK